MILYLKWKLKQIYGDRPGVVRTEHLLQFGLNFGTSPVYMTGI